MDSRTRLVIGGMSTVAASIAVVCAVAMTTSAALADTAGAAVGSRPVVVPPSSASFPTVPTPSVVPVTPQGSTPAEPETVPAPEPEDVAAPLAPQTPVDEPSPATEEQLVAEVAASGSWDALYAWAGSQGWSPARTAAWIARLDEEIAGSRDDEEAGDRIDARNPAEADKTSERDHSGSSFGSKREQSRVPPD